MGKFSPAEIGVSVLGALVVLYLVTRSNSVRVAAGQVLPPSSQALAATNSAALASQTQADSFTLAQEQLHAQSYLTLQGLLDGLKQTKLQNAAALSQIQANGATQVQLANIQAASAAAAAQAQAVFQSQQLAVAKSLGLGAINAQTTIAAQNATAAQNIANTQATAAQNVANTQANAQISAANSQANAYQNAANSQANASIFSSVLGGIGAIFGL